MSTLEIWQSTLPLEGKMVRVRPLAASDLSNTYIGWLNDPVTVRFSNQRFIQHDHQSVRTYFDSFKGSKNVFLAIEDKHNNMLIGTMTIYVQHNHNTADVGILLGDKARWGKGYGRDAWCMVIDWLINTRGLRKVTAGTLSCNYGMIKLMGFAGMHLEATRHAQEIVDGQPQDIHYFARFNVT
jgi:ribosomal-protein-alanine N-acetyltransferase